MAIQGVQSHGQSALYAMPHQDTLQHQKHVHFQDPVAQHFPSSNKDTIASLKVPQQSTGGGGYGLGTVCCCIGGALACFGHWIAAACCCVTGFFSCLCCNKGE